MSEENEVYDVTPERKTLSKAEILAQNDERTEWLEVPEWNTWLKIRSLTVLEVNSIVKMSKRQGGQMDEMQSAMLTFVRGVAEPKFDDMDIDDLKRKSPIVLRIVKEINRVSGIGTDGKSEAEKN